MEMSETAAIWQRRVVDMKLSTDSETGFHNVLKQHDANRKKPYYAKFLPAGEKKQRTLPGSSSALAWEAAAKLAFFEAGFAGELSKTMERLSVRRSREVCPTLSLSPPPCVNLTSMVSCVSAGGTGEAGEADAEAGAQKGPGGFTAVV